MRDYSMEKESAADMTYSCARACSDTYSQPCMRTTRRTADTADEKEQQQTCDCRHGGCAKIKKGIRCAR